jgi:hypothetical protein
MNTSTFTLARLSRLGPLLCAAALAGCGGGSSGDEYTAFLADGHTHPFGLDLDRREARFVNTSGAAIEGPLAIVGDAPLYRFGRQTGPGATARLVVTTEDLVVGGAPIRGRVTPFVAARAWVRSLGEAAGDYNVFGVALPAGGEYASTVAAWRIEASGNLQVCAAGRPIQVSACPAGSLVSYTLRVEGDEFVASSPVATPPIRFRVAMSGGERVLLQGETVASGQGRFAIGLPNTATAFRAGRSQATSSDGTWSVVDHDAINYSSEGVAVDGSASNFSGNLSAGTGDTPAGVRHFDGGSAFVAQGRRLTVLVGRPGTQADGYLQVAVKPD